MKAIDFLKQNRFSVEITYGNFYAQETDLEFFATKEAAEKFYNEAIIDQDHMNNCSWSRDGEQPTFSIELRELRAIPVDMVDDLQEVDAEEMESVIDEIYHTYSVRLKTKEYIYNINYWDTEEEKWKLVEYEGCKYSTLPFSKDVVSLIDGKVSKMKGGIE
jgi:hypothetical protein